MNNLILLRNKVVELGLPCEIIGKFLWVGGDSYKLRYQLQNLGFKWSQGREMWYYTEHPYHKKTDNYYTIDELRKMYNKSSLIQG